MTSFAPAIRARLWAGALADGTGCWPWQRATSRGYGQLSINGTVCSAHRTAYEIVKGPIPDGLQIDHLCRNTRCINPDHMEAVTARVNTLRGNNPPAVNARKTHCKRGHEFVADNTVRTAKGRECRQCRNDNQRLARSRA
ncbi:hypothetical protein LCGC14_1788260 [marine sediment metagenome]|uniref:HNH nuclease domain-containing protein n=1 Tax=marine sediment metagenome TaxID=412755 RepID=A0A0F9HFW7_9ZZZZ